KDSRVRSADYLRLDLQQVVRFQSNQPGAGRAIVRVSKRDRGSGQPDERPLAALDLNWHRAHAFLEREVLGVGADNTFVHQDKRSPDCRMAGEPDFGRRCKYSQACRAVGTLRPPDEYGL